MAHEMPQPQDQLPQSLSGLYAYGHCSPRERNQDVGLAKGGGLRLCAPLLADIQQTQYSNNPKEEYAMLLNGQVTYQKDTVIFNFLPGVSFPIDEDEEDHIIIKSGGESVEFSRGMINDYNVPNPTGDGKSMKSWEFKITDCRDSDSILLIKEKKFFEIFEKVVENGKIVYSGFETEQDLIQNFQQTYGKSPSDANQLAKKFSNPIF